MSAAAIEVVSGKPGSIREGIDGPTPGEVDSRRLAGWQSKSNRRALAFVDPQLCVKLRDSVNT